MASVLYRAYDLLTKEELDDIPMYGVSMEDKLSGSGTLTGTVRMDDERKPAQNILDATIPGRTLLVPELEGIPLTAYIIWTRTYQSSGRTMQFYGETVESYPHQRINSTTRTYNNVDARNVIVSLWNAIQQDPHGNLGVIMPSAFANQLPVQRTFNSYEFDNFGKAIDDLVSSDPPFDYKIRVTYDTNGLPRFELVLGYPMIGTPASTTNLLFGFPGNITQFWYPENASAGATTLWGVGKGDGSSQLQSSVSNTDLLDAGYPMIEDVVSLKNIGTKSALDARTRAEARRRRSPISVPSFELDPTVEPKFGDWGLGDYAKFEIEDVRFPNGITLTQRIIGWRYTPATGDGPALVNIDIEGVEDADG